MKICNPTEVINNAIPELSEIENYNNTIYLSEQNWNNRLKTIERKNLNKYHRSTSWVSMIPYFDPCVIAYQDGDTVIINQAKYKLIRKYLMSDDFNKKG